MCHDVGDATCARIVSDEARAVLGRDRCGEAPRRLRALIIAIRTTEVIGRNVTHVKALTGYRTSDDDSIFVRDDSRP